MIAEYLHNNGCDVVVSIVAPYIWLRDEFKARIGLTHFEEFYVHTTQKRERDHFHVLDYVAPTENFTSVDTTKDNPEQSFNYIINHLREVNKL